MISIDGGLNGWWHLDLDIANKHSHFNWTFNHQSVQSLSFHDAADYTAGIIAKKYNNLHLLMSGGLDSECVADVLYRNNVPFVPVIGYITASNNQDYFYAMHWCDQHGTQPLMAEFEINDMRLQKAYAWVCKNYGIVNDTFFTKALIDLVTERQGHVLLGETNLTNESRTSGWDDPIGKIFDVTAHGLFGSIYTQGQHPAEFFAYTPELLLAMVTDVDTTINNALAKSRLYNVPFRPKTWPFSMLTKDIKLKIEKICLIEDFPKSVGQSWTQQELVELLKKNK